jgi:hypothetical protein
MGEIKWMENRGSLSQMYCYVMNSFTWDYQNEGILDVETSALLNPCIPFLLDECLFYFESRAEFGDDDEVVTLCEIFTTIEAIICIDM